MLPMDSGCDTLDFGCQAGEGVKSAIGQALSNGLEEIAQAIKEAVAKAVAGLTAGWTYFPTPDLIQSGEGAKPNPPDKSPPDPSNLETILGWVAWSSLGICVLSLIAAGAMMAIRARRGEGGEHLTKIGYILIASLLIGSASGIARALLGDGPSDGGSGPVQEVQSYLWWYVGAAVILSVFVGAAKMAWEQRADPGKELVRSLITLAVVSGAGVATITIATRAADNFALWLVTGTADGDFGGRVLEMLALGSGWNAAVGVMLAIVLGSVAMFLSIIQLILMLIRDGMLVLLAAILPLAASFTNTEMGKTWFKKACAWTIAFILYKPAAAIVYAVAFQLTGSDGGDSDSSRLINTLIGLTLMLISLIALPALMKFVVPMASLSGGGAAVGAMAGVASAVGGKAGEMASGAVDKGQGAANSDSGGGWGGGPPGSKQSANTGQGGGDDQSSPSGPEQAPETRQQGMPDTGGGGGLAGSGSGGAASGGASGGAGAAAGGAGAALEVAEMIKEAGDAVAEGVQGTIDEATEGPDGSN